MAFQTSKSGMPPVGDEKGSGPQGMGGGGGI